MSKSKIYTLRPGAPAPAVRPVTLRDVLPIPAPVTAQERADARTIAEHLRRIGTPARAWHWL